MCHASYILMLVRTHDLIATTLDSMAQCVFYEEGHFPTERQNQQHQEVNIATSLLSDPHPLHILAIALKMPFIFYSKRIKSKMTRCPFILMLLYG